MAIQLSPETERQIEELVNGGRFESVDQCVATCLGWFRLQEEETKERMAELKEHGDEVRRLVAEGAAALQRGDYIDYDDESLKEFFEQIKREGREQLRLAASS
jgi:Arc/MetJ-type ribon-helix-helix transcriptional regulator